MELGGVKKNFSIKVNIETISKNELFIIVLTDISEAEEYRLYLEDKIEAELEKNRESERKIYRLKKEQSLSELLSNIAHQWRQPLNTISLSLNEIDDMMEFGDLEKDRVSAMVERSMNEINYISSIITTLTQLKPNHKEREVFCIDTAIISAVDFMKAPLKSAGFNYVLTLESSEIFGNRKNISDIIMKMVSNSIDQAERKNIDDRSLEIRSKKVGDSAVIEIEDSCGGVAKDVLENIFDPYTTTSFKSRGKGLSLFLIKNVIENSFEGNIEVKNSENGAIFTITLPLNQPSE